MAEKKLKTSMLYDWASSYNVECSCEIKNIQPSSIGDLSGAIGATMLARLKIGKGAHPK
jgi:hypothetical protein